MNKNCTVLLAIISLNLNHFTHAIYASESKTTSEAESHYQIAHELYRGYKYSDAETELKKALIFDQEYAPAYNLLANIYLKKGTIQGRMEAKWAARSSIKYAPDSIGYHITMVNVLREQGFLENAQKYLEELKTRFPDNPEVLYQLANFYQKNAERLNNLVSAMQASMFNHNYFKQIEDDLGDSFESRVQSENATPIISFGKFHKKEFRKASDTYKKLKELDPHFGDVDRQLALLAYQISDWIKMLVCAQDFVRYHPENRNSYLVLGLAYLRMGNYVKANDSFINFRERLLPVEREKYEYFDRFLSVPQRIEIEKMSKSDRDFFHDKFWLSRDPLFLTEYNERLLEHYGRVAEAYLLFSVPSHNLEGWSSDMGITWIRYGPPRHRMKLLKMSHINMDGNLREFWYYNDFRFAFYEFPYRSGYMKFVEDGSLGRFGTFAEELQKKLPDLFTMKVPGKKIDFPRYAVDFRGKKRKSRVQLYYEVPITSLYHSKKDENYVVNLNQGVFLFDEDWNNVLKDVRKKDYVFPEKTDSISMNMINEQSHIEVLPGNYNLAIEFKDDSSANIGAIRERLVIESYGYDSLQVSDLLLAKIIEPKPSTESITIDNLNFTPNIERIYRKPQTIFLYFEIYNLKLNGMPGNSKYQLEYSVQYKKSTKDKEWTIGRTLGRLFNFSKNKFELATTAEYSGANPVENMYIEIDPSSLNPGIYRLNLKVMDQLSNQNIEKQTVFYIKE